MRYYGDVYVTAKLRLRISFESKKKPRKEVILQLLRNREYDDITDEETLEYITVDNVDVHNGV